MPHRFPRMRARAHQAGQAMVLAVFLISIGVGAALLTTAQPISVSISNRQSKEDETVLAQAKDALIGRSASDANRPGSLPCPDTDNDGVAEIFVGSSCPSYIGRLPWRTLGLPQMRDSRGEVLWYALSSRFRDHSTAEPINSDTKGDLTVYLGTTSTTLTSEAVAVVFAPGSVVGAQVRDVANQNNPANYLESGAGWNNASAAGPFLLPQPPATANDRLLVITTADLMTPIEQRAGRELIALLAAYKAGSLCNCYPWADFSDGVSNTGDTNGRIPLLGATPESWGAAGVAIPAWLINNQWWWPFLYTFDNFGALRVDGVAGYSVVLVTTGPAGASRPIGSPGSWDDSWWANYVDDAQNSDMGTWFDTPSSTAYARDRLFTIP